MKKPILTVALASTLAFGAFGAQATLAKPAEVNQVQPVKVFDHKVIEKINVENIYKNIDYLSQTPRVAGTESEDNAVQYIKEQFESYGYETEIQPFTFYGYTPPSNMELTVDDYDGELQPSSFTYSVNGDVTGELAYAGLGTAEELEGMDLTGKIALIKRGELSFAEKVLNAAEKGAAGVIIFNNADGALNGTLGSHNDDYVPALALSKEEGEALLALHNSGETLTASIKIEGAEAGEKVSHNVIATKQPTNKTKSTDEIIVVGSHHDSVAGAPGANDDASGTAMTLELARVFKDLPTDTEIRFATFGAEELGLLGSYHYVDSLSEDEISRTVANFNLDMVGSRDAGDLVMWTLDGQENLVTELSQASSERLNGEQPQVYQGGRSDHVPFAEAGIPAALFIHSPTEPWYHSPDDSIGKISKEKLQEVAEIVGAAIYEQARFDRMGPKPKKTPKVKASPEMIHEQDVK
ncbi:M20/M25/M40 family metallo-hydrolase [Bacillus sp. ISL-47]|uniref:M20/M25/M40 family metallo-hydrolase n=1 Tax=Bacillus sp. ISL-47 TaxID=2819130 RepID=UPI001BE88ED0|nr:M20/M25/M40 family metallo-hydrolase [Bacillus sp. ISL-47]MBT2688887.1 M20/M25/M40 family metallo-hydrolase [Bacillus sp. ISL-47]MBT2709088.1 M20/M25/M40 family metallo-hydrolase [Pseudomonas sp. ISL-84]